MARLEEEKQILQEQLKSAGSQIIHEEADPNRKRIIGTLTQRQAQMLEILECVAVRMEQDSPAGKRRIRRAKAEKGILHPVVTIILSIAVLVCALLSANTGQWLWTVIFAVLLIGQSIIRLTTTAKTSGLSKANDPELYVDMDQAQLVLDRAADKFYADSESICNMFATQNLDRLNAYEAEVIKIYSSLYEAQLDNPEVEDFKYALSLTMLLLQKMGLAPVAFTPENRKLFRVEQADYHDEMRCPAIVREKTGELVRRGEYVQRRNRGQSL